MRKKKRSSPFKKVFLCLLALYSLPFFFCDGAFVYERRPVAPPKEPESPGVIVYIINMDRSPQRWASILPQAQQLGLPMERIPGVDGQLLSEEELSKLVDREQHCASKGRYAGKGEVGCALSHTKAWKRFLDSPYAYALVLEDDVFLDPGRVQRIVSQLLTVPHMWDTVFFNTDFRSGVPMTMRSFGEDGELVVHLRTTWGTQCYLINRKAAATLSAHAFPMKTDVDLFSKRSWEFGLKVAGIHPRFCTADKFPSDIGYGYEDVPHGFFPVLKSRIQLHVSSMKTRIMRFVYNLKLYFQLRET
ncbi:MAG: glycosyltransferase family 25 protein [Holosporales bacterium]|nr:glycosyltransferase family 25 protein [Holosporales bacterium]